MNTHRPTAFLFMAVTLSGWITLLSPASAKAATLEKFIADYQAAVKRDLTEDDLTKLRRDHSTLLTPHSDVSAFHDALRGRDVKPFPLFNFKTNAIYKSTISGLLDSENPNKRVLAYMVVAAANDNAFNAKLREKIKSDKPKGCRIWAGMALLHMKDSHTTELFDFLVENEEFGDAHMLPLFLNLDKESLKKTAYQRSQSEKNEARILVAFILSHTGLSPRTDKILRQGVKTWPEEIKGYAIEALRQLRAPDLLELLKPHIDAKLTRRVVLHALASSPSATDQQFIFSQIPEKDPIPEDTLDCLLESKNPVLVHKWLELIQRKNAPHDYYFHPYDQPLLSTKEFRPKVIEALRTIKNPEYLSNLVRALEKDQDPATTAALIELLKHDNSTVRYWAGSALKGNRSPVLARALPDLIKSEKYRTTALTRLIIENDINNLHATYEKILYGKDVNRDWRRSCMDYLSTYPLEKHKKLFTGIVTGSDEAKRVVGVEQSLSEDAPTIGPFIQNSAIIGLGNLRDSDSVPLIVKAMEAEKFEINLRPHLIALHRIGSPAAKQAVKKYASSDEDAVREIVKQLLDTWPDK